MTIQDEFNAALTRHQAGDLDQAATGYRRVLAALPSEPTAMSYLGMARAQIRPDNTAVALLTRAGALSPENPAIYNNLGNALVTLGRRSDALAPYRRGLVLLPGYQVLLANVAALATDDAGRLESYGRALACDVGYLPAITGMIAALGARGRKSLTSTWARRAMAVAPQEPVAHFVVTDQFAADVDPEGALRASRRALCLGRETASAHLRFAIASDRLGVPDDAGRACRCALVDDPALASAHMLLGSLELGGGFPEVAVAAYGRATAISAVDDTAEGSRLFALAFLDRDDPQSLVRAHRKWATRHRSGRRAVQRALIRCRQGRLRVGYVSPEFVKHGSLCQILPVLSHHDRSRVEVFAYGQMARRDRWTAEVQRRVDGWRDLSGLSIDRQAEAVADDDIDVLVNLTGYLPPQRALFARRVAPVQVAYVNHISTTALATIDGRITDEWLEPAGEPFLDDSERLIRLTTGFCTYAPPNAPEVLELPALRNGHVTFGVFNNIAKASDRAITSWARILLSMPGSRILIKGYGLSAERARRRIIGQLGGRGVERERIELVGRVSGDHESLAVLGRADVALDPFPFNGGLSTLETLWMGVPVVTLIGSSFVHRLGLSLLVRAGFAHWVAASPDQYADIAVGLASDLGRLAALRRGMRDSLMHSVLFDAAAHTRELEAVYRALREERSGTG